MPTSRSTPLARRPLAARQLRSTATGRRPGWVTFTGNAADDAGQYNNIALEVNDSEVTVTLNGKLVAARSPTRLSPATIGNLFISSDAAAGTKGSIHIDNVLIGTVIAGKAKDPSPADAATNVAARSSY